jgi:hypothetical protein
VRSAFSDTGRESALCGLISPRASASNPSRIAWRCASR